MTNTKELKQRILDATEIAIEELIKVLKETIVGVDVEKPDPEKMKAAAQAKRVAFDDAIYMTQQLQDERNMLDDSGASGDITSTENFAERFTKDKK